MHVIRRGVLLGMVVGILGVGGTVLRAQEVSSSVWTSSIHLSIGASLANTDWVIAHPIISGSSRRMERILGTGDRSTGVHGGVELRKRAIAIQVNAGWTSSQVTLTEVPDNLTGNAYEIGRSWDFSTYQVEGALVYFPLKEGGSLRPFVSGGVGLLVARGDTEMTGGSLSLDAGVRLPLSGRTEAQASVGQRYLRYSDFDLLPPVMTPTLVLKPMVVAVGLRLAL